MFLHTECGCLLLVAGRKRVEVSPPFLFFYFLGRDHPISHKCIVPALFQQGDTSFKIDKLVLEPSRSMPVSLITFTAWRRLELY